MRTSLLLFLACCCAVLSLATPLFAEIHVDAGLGKTDSVRQALAADPALLNALDDRGNTPLISAASFGRLETAKLLIDKGADVNARNKAGNTPLLALMSLQINDQPFPKLQEKAVQSRLDRIELIKLLLAHGADVNAKDSFGWTALHKAVVNHSPRVNPMLDVITLLVTKIDVNSGDSRGKTPLHYAAEFNNLEAAQLLLAKGAKVNARANDGTIPLHEAPSCHTVFDGNTGKHTISLRKPMIDLLVEKGGDASAKDKEGRTPIFNAESREALEVLLAKGADLQVKAADGATVLHQAARSANKNDGEVMRFLLAKGLDANAKTNKGRTPLFYAVQVDSSGFSKPSLNPAIPLLLAKGLSLQDLDADGNTLLHAVAEFPIFLCSENVSYLLKNKLNPTVKNSAGLTAVDIARKNEWQEAAIQFLLGKGPNPMMRDETTEAPQTPVNEQPKTTRPAPKPGPKAGTVKVNPKDGAEMVFVPAGEFTMGSNTGFGAAPQHTVYLDGFWVYKTEVTANQYRQFCKETGYAPPKQRPAWGWKADHPMVFVTWEDACAYAKWAGAQLPTEAQWEKAARGIDGRKFPWGNTLDKEKFAGSHNSSGGPNAEIGTHAVGSFPGGASPYGVLDMTGNVWEWCADWFDGNYYRTSPTDNPTGPKTGQYHVLRSGSWAMFDAADFACFARRQGNLPQTSPEEVGFRCVIPFE